MNLALLRHAGRHLLMIDDDAVIRAARLPDGSQAPRFDKHQQMEIFFTMKEARAALQPYEQDPFTAHAAALGQLVSALVHNAVGAEPESSFIDEKTSQLISFNPQRSRVRYTLNGLLGDTGTHNDLMVFAPRHLKAHTAIFGSDACYRRLKASDRIIYRGSPWPSLYNSGWLHQVTCVGVDGSGFAAPIYPAGRGADTYLGLMLRFLYPFCYGLLLPFTLEHRALGKRAWRFDPRIFTFNPSVNGMLMSFINSLRISNHLQPARKMAAFAEALRERLHAGNPRHTLQAHAKMTHMSILARAFRGLATALEFPDGLSPLWQQDIELLQEEIIRQLGDPPAMSAEHEERVRRGLLRYADAIDGWNTLFEYRKANHSEGSV